MTARLPFLVATVVAVSGCVAPDETTNDLVQRGPVANFATYVQPILQVGCATLDCHGQEDRPLRLYARNGLRMDVALRGEDASMAELQANIEAIDGLEPELTQVEDDILLLKPLAVAAGGIHHKGGNLWPDQNSDEYRCLHAWLRTGVSDPASQAICTRVLP